MTMLFALSSVQPADAIALRRRISRPLATPYNSASSTPASSFTSTNKPRQHGQRSSTSPGQPAVSSDSEQRGQARVPTPRRGIRSSGLGDASGWRLASHASSSLASNQSPPHRSHRSTVTVATLCKHRAPAARAGAAHRRVCHSRPVMDCRLAVNDRSPATCLVRWVAHQRHVRRHRA